MCYAARDARAVKGSGGGRAAERAGWRALAFGGVVLTALLTLAAARWATARYEGALAERAAATTAAYLSLVTPAAKGGAGYELPRLLIESHAVGELAELT